MAITESATTAQFDLDRGERQLWAGTPRQGLVLRAADIFMVPFSLLWGGFAFFWEASVMRKGAGPLLALWGVPFVGVGIYMIAGRFFVDALRRANTAYALTSSRVMIRSGVFSSTLKSLSLRTLSDVTLTERADGSGTITFGPSVPFAAMYAGMSWPGIPQQTALEQIPSARKIYDMIREAQNSANVAAV